MLYSCFNPNKGLYDVYEDSATHVVNGDLPVPKFDSRSQIGNIGVPSIEAGRPLPSGAKRVGESWTAKGIVVNCGRVGVFGDTTKGEFGDLLMPFVLIGAGIWFIWYYSK